MSRSGENRMLRPEGHGPDSLYNYGAGVESPPEFGDRLDVRLFALVRLSFSFAAVAAEVPPAARHDFGKVVPGTQWTHVFVFTNSLSRPMKIEGVHPSCSCLVVEDWSRSVAAGKTGSVSVRLYTAASRGPLAESLRLRFAGADPADMTFAVAAFVQAPIEATPEFVRLIPDPATRTNAFTYVQITNHLSTEVILTNAVSSSERFAAKLEVGKPGRSYRLRIEAIPPFNSGNTFGTIQVTTSLREYPRLEITTMVPAKDSK